MPDGGRGSRCPYDGFIEPDELRKPIGSKDRCKTTAPRLLAGVREEVGYSAALG